MNSMMNNSMMNNNMNNSMMNNNMNNSMMMMNNTNMSNSSPRLKTPPRFNHKQYIPWYDAAATATTDNVTDVQRQQHIDISIHEQRLSLDNEQCESSE